MKTMFKGTWARLAAAATVLVPAISFAEEHAATTANLWAAPSAALGIALAVIAAATAQGRIATAYMEGASRNPGAEKAMKTQLILSLVFVETLVIFTLGVVFTKM